MTRPIYYYWHIGADVDGSDVLLYEGESFDPGRRSGEHSREKPYWPILRRIEVAAFPPGTTKAEARQFEAEQIGGNRAPWNDAGNPEFDVLAWRRAELLRRAAGPVLSLNRARWAIHRLGEQIAVWGLRAALVASGALAGVVLS